MPNIKNFLEDKGAVSPVIGVVLMVAITVILAAAIGSSVFGNDIAEQAPQANINVKLGTQSTSNNSTVILEHLGGDPLEFDTDHLITKITVSVNKGDSKEVANSQFNMSVGDSYELKLNGTGGIDIGHTDIVNIKIVDVATQQVLCEKDVRF